jgi:hypothetical protein
MITKWTRSTVSARLALLLLAVPAGAGQAQQYAVSGPFSHDNLSVYIVHGSSGPGPVPMTLDEAMAAKSVRVTETEKVNELLVENSGDREVFIQSGEIVQGGLQDRVMGVSLLLPPHSGQVPIDAFCVERGRWSARDNEDTRTFRAAGTSLPPRGGKTLNIFAVSAPTLSVPAAAPPPAPHSAEAQREQLDLARLLQQRSQTQALLWSEASQMQADLSRRLRADPAPSKSPTSLALTLENKHLHDMEDAFIDDLQSRGLSDGDVIGYVSTVDGRLSDAQIYESNALFRKMWPKQLRSAAVEALAAPEHPHVSSQPSVGEVQSFLAVSAKGEAKALTTYVVENIADDSRKVSIETRRSSGGWVARSYQEK